MIASRNVKFGMQIHYEYNLTHKLFTKYRFWVSEYKTIERGVNMSFRRSDKFYIGKIYMDSASNRNEYQQHFLRGKGGRRVSLTTLPQSCAVVK